MTPRIQKILPLLLLFAATAAAAENRIYSEHFGDGIVHYTAQDRGLAEKVMETYPKCLEEVNRLLEGNYKRVIGIYLYRPDCGFEQLGVEDAGRTTRAYALCRTVSHDCIVLLMHHYEGGAAYLYPVLMHETVHLVVGEMEFKGGQTLPKWFDEGLAEWAAHHKEGWSLDERRELREGVKPWSELAEKFPEAQGGEIYLAYLQSKHIVMYLVEEYGLKAIRELLVLVRDGSKFEEAFRTATGVTVAEAEEEWKEFLYSATADDVLMQIIGPLVGYGTGVLIIAVAVIGIVCLRRRRRAIIRQFEEEESRGMFYPPPPPPVSDRT